MPIFEPAPPSPIVPSLPQKAHERPVYSSGASSEVDAEERPRSPHCLKCTYLQPGTRFKGSQKVPTNQEDAWIVNVTIQGHDPARGYVCGSMEAQNLPTSDETVVTFWEGEIVDNTNFSFHTGRWDATRAKDIEHWSKFAPFQTYKEAVLQGSSQSIDMSQSRYVFMRWKEQFFVNVGADCGLTIAGFYYVCFDRQLGTVEGYYHDANSSPWQRLELAVHHDAHGIDHPTYSFA